MTDTRDVYPDIVHASSCKRALCNERCATAKSLLAHIDLCGKFSCNFQNCNFARFVIAKAEESWKNNAAIPTKKDCFADVSNVVLHLLCDELYKEYLFAKDSGSARGDQYLDLFYFQFVNKRVYHNFFRLPRALGGYLKPKRCDFLSICQLSDGSTMFHFKEQLFQGDGFYSIFTKNGEIDRRRYNDRHYEEANEYIQSTHGLIKDHNTCNVRPASLSSSFYDGLRTSLQEFCFGNMFVGSVVVDAQFRKFWSEVGYPLDDGCTEMANTSPWEARCRKLFQNIKNHP